MPVSTQVRKLTPAHFARNTPPGGGGRYQWATVGDINAFFGLMLDNVVNLAVLGGILIGAFGFPASLVYTRMFPGTALGVLFGDAVYTWMAFRLARRTGRTDVTAMPLGLDAPSTIGMALTVLGPAFIAAKAKMPTADAAMVAWEVGMATMVLIGLFKLCMAFVGDYVRRIVPDAGLLGSIAGVGIALLGTLQLAEIFSEPVVGLLALGIIVYALVAKLRLPFRVPPVLAAAMVGAAIYYGLGALGLSLVPVGSPSTSLYVGLPVPTLGFVRGFSIAVREYLPLALPFGLLTIIGGINVTESARVAGDDYNTRDILLTEAVATLLAGVCGGVSQTTPYIGHPAFKAMGGRAAYTLATGIFIGLGGVLGYVAFLADALPKPALAPILVFVALEITDQAFHATPRRHTTAVTMALLPCLAQLVAIMLSQVQNGALASASIDPAGTMRATGISNPAFIQTSAVMFQMANGFILTAMLWGAAVAFLIDHRTRATSLTLLACAVFSFFGFIHSALPTGGIYLPWQLRSPVPFHWAAGYAILAVLVLLHRSEDPANLPPLADAKS